MGDLGLMSMIKRIKCKLQLLIFLSCVSTLRTLTDMKETTWEKHKITQVKFKYNGCDEWHLIFLVLAKKLSNDELSMQG